MNRRRGGASCPVICMKYYFLALLIVGADQLSKWAVRSFMEAGESIRVLGDFFCLTYVQNSGAAFSMFRGQYLLLIVLPVLMMGVVLGYLHRHKGRHWSLYTAGALIIAGGIGNLIDRIVFGWVTDMIDFSFFSPVFNVADIGVTVGCAIAVVYVITEERRKTEQKK